MNIDIGSITGILLADGWHDVWGKSANVGTVTLYERRDETNDTSVVYDGGNFPVLWFSMQEQPEGIPLMGPVTSILAVRLKP